MQRQVVFSALVTLSNLAAVFGQAASPTSDPLNDFINGVQAGAGAIKSAASAESTTSSSTSSSSSSSSTTPTSSTPPPPPASSSPASSGLSPSAKNGIIAGAVIGAVLLIALVAGVCCCLCLRRRHRKRHATPVGDEEIKSWKSKPANPGRDYANNGRVHSMEQHPTVPLMAAGALPYGHQSRAPSLSQHPAMRAQQAQNPFADPEPVPDLGPAQSHHRLDEGLAGGAAVAAAGYGAHKHEENKRSRDSGYDSRSRSRSGMNPGGATGLPTHNTIDRPPTPFGLGGIGQPYEDTHVRNLQTEPPSRDLRYALATREVPFPASTYDDPNHAQYRNSRGYSTPPEVPSRSPHRMSRAGPATGSSYTSSLSITTPSHSSSDQYEPRMDPYQPAHHNRTAAAPWEQHQNRYSDTPATSNPVSPPPVPWESTDYTQPYDQNYPPPRQTRNSNGFTTAEGRRASQSPATSINGQPRRLRFEDLQAGDGHDGYDGHEYARWSQGVGEAL